MTNDCCCCCCYYYYCYCCCCCCCCCYCAGLTLASFSLCVAGLYISNRQVRIQVKESGGAGTPAGTTGPPRPRSISVTPDMDVPQSQQSSSYLSSSSSWSSTPSSPGAGEGLESVSATKLSGISSGGGHSRLPSTDSGIQADAGWDSLNRSHQKSLGKVRGDLRGGGSEGEVVVALQPRPPPPPPPPN